MGKILIKGARLLDPSQNLDQKMDLLVEDGVVVALDRPGAIPNAEEVISAEKYWLVPGFIDMHVHLREPGQEYKETIQTGTHAAVAGGFTSVACMANTSPVNDSPYVTAFIRERAKAHALCRVFPIGAVTKGLKGEELAEIGGMKEEGIVAISDDGMPVMNSYLMRKALDYSKAFDLPLISHAEDWNLVGQGVMNEGALSSELGLRGNPSAAEEILIAREIALCRLTGARVHIAHLSTALGLKLVRAAKKEGLPITAEVTPHHLALTEEHLRTYDPNFKMSPPLRTQKDSDFLLEGLSDGTIDVIATDHAPHGIIDKHHDFSCCANGIIGMEAAAPVTLRYVHEKKLSPMRWVEAMSTRAAKILSLPHGTLKKGSLADFTLIDPEHVWTLTEKDLFSKSRNCPFLGEKFKGKIIQTWVEGKKVYEA